MNKRFRFKNVEYDEYAIAEQTEEDYYKITWDGKFGHSDASVYPTHLVEKHLDSGIWEYIEDIITIKRKKLDILDQIKLFLINSDYTISVYSEGYTVTDFLTGKEYKSRNDEELLEIMSSITLLNSYED